MRSAAAVVFIVLLMMRRGGMAKHCHWVVPARPESRKQQISSFKFQVRPFCSTDKLKKNY
jgi:hypothetical protein